MNHSGVEHAALNNNGDGDGSGDAVSLVQAGTRESTEHRRHRRELMEGGSDIANL